MTLFTLWGATKSWAGTAIRPCGFLSCRRVGDAGPPSPLARAPGSGIRLPRVKSRESKPHRSKLQAEHRKRADIAAGEKRQAAEALRALPNIPFGLTATRSEERQNWRANKNGEGLPKRAGLVLDEPLAVLREAVKSNTREQADEDEHLREPVV